jgi:hypothetical protein
LLKKKKFKNKEVGKEVKKEQLWLEDKERVKRTKYVKGGRKVIKNN